MTSYSIFSLTWLDQQPTVARPDFHCHSREFSHVAGQAFIVKIVIQSDIPGFLISKIGFIELSLKILFKYLSTEKHLPIFKDKKLSGASFF